VAQFDSGRSIGRYSAVTVASEPLFPCLILILIDPIKGYLLASKVIASPRESACKLSNRSGCSSVCLRGCLVRVNQSQGNDLRGVGLDLDFQMKSKQTSRITTMLKSSGFPCDF